jgi:hypothetical protein
MVCPINPRRLCAVLALAFAATGFTACSPSVTNIELDAARSRLEAAKGRLAKLDGELKALQGEVKALTSFSGPDYDARMQKAEGLRGEKAELEAIKAEVEAKVAKFTADAKAHREAHAQEAKENPE